MDKICSSDQKRKLPMYSMRNINGQSVVMLMLVLAVFLVGSLGLFTFEMSRFGFAQQQLKACVESAALAGAATTASSNSTSPTTTQTIAMATALQMFQKNSILDQSLSAAKQVTSLPMNPGANQSQLYFQWLDPNTFQPVILGSTDGKILQVTGAFGVAPIFYKFLSLSMVYPVIYTSNGGLPMLDVILCFDISASMDDFTLVTIVDRYEISTKVGTKTTTSNGYTTIANGPLYTAFGATSATGTAVNATFPQGLDDSTSTDGKWTFSASQRGTNYGAAATGSSSTTNFTDVVVNIDGTNTFNAGTTITYNGTSYYFPANNIGCLVEAARGNLESTTIATTANVPYSSWTGVTPKSGYYQAYLQAVFAQRHPISDAIAAAQNFFTVMNNDADVHFGLVTFSTNAGASATSTVPANDTPAGNITESTSTYKSNADPTDPLSPMPPNPTINLSPTLGSAYSNYSTVNSSVQNLLAYGGTNISGALSQAISQMTPTSKGGLGLTRAGATKVIVLFTDGLPTDPTSTTVAAADARAEAVAASKLGIPIYCIGLCMVSSLQSAQTAILTNTDSNATTGGIAGISGNGAGYYQATQISELNLVFENVARALVQLVQI